MTEEQPKAPSEPTPDQQDSGLVGGAKLDRIARMMRVSRESSAAEEQVPATTPQAEPPKQAEPVSPPEPTPSPEGAAPPTQPVESGAEQEPGTAPDPEAAVVDDWNQRSGSTQKRIKTLYAEAKLAEARAAELEKKLQEQVNLQQQATLQQQAAPQPQVDIKSVLDKVNLEEGFDSPEPNREEDPDAWHAWNLEKRAFRAATKAATINGFRVLQAVAPHLHQQEVSARQKEYSDMAPVFERFGVKADQIRPFVDKVIAANPSLNVRSASYMALDQLGLLNGAPAAPEPPAVPSPGGGRANLPHEAPRPLTAEEQERALFSTIRNPKAGSTDKLRAAVSLIGKRKRSD